MSSELSPEKRTVSNEAHHAESDSMIVRSRDAFQSAVVPGGPGYRVVLEAGTDSVAFNPGVSLRTRWMWPTGAAPT